jgi:hypothetical protein
MMPLNRYWSTHLPRPHNYFPTVINDLGTPGGSGHAQGSCPFHKDDGTSAKITVNLNNGLWHCPRCGRGNMPTFHARLKGIDWSDAVNDLVENLSDEALIAAIARDNLNGKLPEGAK